MSLTFSQQLEPQRFKKVYKKVLGENLYRSPHSLQNAYMKKKESFQDLEGVGTDFYKSTYQQHLNDNMKEYQQEPKDRYFFKKEVLTKATVNYIPKLLHNQTYQYRPVEKSRQIYNTTQPVIVTSPEKIHAIDKSYFKDNKIDKKIKQTFLVERRHYKFKLPTAPFKKTSADSSAYYSFK